MFEDDEQIHNFFHLEGEFNDLIIEENDPPLDTVSQFKVAEPNLSALFDKKAQVERAVSREATMEEVDVGRSDETQRSDEQQGYLNSLCGKEILQLKINAIPRGLAPLEKLFDQNDVTKEPKLIPNCDDVKDVNI